MSMPDSARAAFRINSRSPTCVFGPRPIWPLPPVYGLTTFEQTFLGFKLRSPSERNRTLPFPLYYPMVPQLAACGLSILRRTKENQGVPRRTEESHGARRTEQNQGEPKRNGESRGEPRRTEKNREEPRRTEDSRGEPRRTEENRGELRAEESQGEPRRAEQNRAEPRRKEENRREPSAKPAIFTTYQFSTRNDDSL